MAYGNWDEILREYKETYLPLGRSPYTEHAESMIDLIPRIRNLFPDVIPLTSHSTLCLKLTSSKTKICIWGNEIGSYEVYLYDPRSVPQKNRVEEREYTDSDGIIPVLQEYLKRLQEKVT